MLKSRELKQNGKMEIERNGFKEIRQRCCCVSGRLSRLRGGGKGTWSHRVHVLVEVIWCSAHGRLRQLAKLAQIFLEKDGYILLEFFFLRICKISNLYTCYP